MNDELSEDVANAPECHNCETNVLVGSHPSGLTDWYCYGCENTVHGG